MLQGLFLTGRNGLRTVINKRSRCYLRSLQAHFRFCPSRFFGPFLGPGITTTFSGSWVKIHGRSSTKSWQKNGQAHDTPPPPIPSVLCALDPT